MERYGYPAKVYLRRSSESADLDKSFIKAMFYFPPEKQIGDMAYHFQPVVNDLQEQKDQLLKACNKAASALQAIKDFGFLPGVFVESTQDVIDQCATAIAAAGE